jgi:D-3-phosphoglycerate dehydrogenase
VKVLVGFDLENYPHARALEAAGACDFVRYDRAFLDKRVAEYDLIVPHLGVALGADVLARAAKLRMIATPTTGRDHFDLKYCIAKGIEVVSLNEDMEFLGRITSTAEHAFLLILAAARNLRRASERVTAERSWDNVDLRGSELKGKTLGIVGYGRLGRMVEGYARAFGMTILVHDVAAVKPAHGAPCALPRLLAESDVVSLHAKWLPGEPPVIDAKAVALMKPGAILVNTARGGLVDSRAVLEGVRSGRLGSVAIDVANKEYCDYRLPEDPLVSEALTDPRILVTPHVGGATLDAHRVVFAELAQLIKNRLAPAQEKP